jgi:2-polyprenyl-6-hydroxyphenyl methylase/3-demethylubiquinone-9 3-methyltransferase
MQSQTARASGPGATLDPREVARFEQLAGTWWDPDGKMRPLHRQGPARLSFIRDVLCRHFDRPPQDHKPLQNISILDIGCGGGLAAEPLARLGGRVTGIDPTPEAIAVARRHADAQGLAIDYRAARAEALIDAGERFDAVVCLEVIEHVPDAGAFLKTIAGLVRPGGMLVLSTLNRTWKSYALAIDLQAAGFGEPRFSGLVYDVMRDEWRLDPDRDVNYLAAAALPA